ncbi:helix-turn-helix domain-containing protein [Shouchella hunanensis]|uniref:Helix-turn-helix transcriptional regulator n=1 Tax=Shouchella hunanensis TaxID=766894 RepID=A0ABY7W559_9BACI|nr:helix-turn-helix transcriptional regulator [Shouchella hunanensis]WDF02621.1 helix-turn-helix transcriptional regulator [Shouchella hunanensis]GAF20774.1 DNA-binding protein [Bacillus sp. JCM 19047]
MSTLGERIRQLRKQRGKTLAEVAEGRLTKGMLSLIENNKAQPSMESLTHIAEALETDPQSLLADVNVITEADLRSLIIQLKALLTNHRYDDVASLLTPFAGMTLPHTYEAAQFVRDLGKAYFYKSQSIHQTDTGLFLLEKKTVNSTVDENNWRTYFENAEQRFIELSFLDEAANTALDYIEYLTFELEYEKAIELFTKKQAAYADQIKDFDPLTLSKWNFQEVALLMIMGKSDLGRKRLKESLTFAIEKRQFYKVDQYYRFAIHFAMLAKDEKEVNYYLHKHHLLTELLEDDYLKSIHTLNKAIVAIMFENNPTKALEVINDRKNFVRKDDTLRILFQHIYGQALYELKRYKESLHYLPSINEYPFRIHVLDLSMLTTADAYKALCYAKLGEDEKARVHATKAKESILKQNYAIDYHKSFILQTYDDIFKEV